MDDSFRIHLHIADCYFPVKIKRNEKEEALYRDAAKLVNKMVDKYRERFAEENPDIKMKDILAMVAYHFAINTLRKEAQTDDCRAMEVIEQLTKELEEALK